MEQDCFLAVLSSPLSFRRCKSRTESRNTTQTLPESDEAFRPEPVLQLFQSICRSLELPVTNRPELTDRLLGRNRRRILLAGNRASNRGVHIFPAAPLRVTSTEARARHTARHLLKTKNAAERFLKPSWNCDCFTIEIRPGQNTFGGERADRVIIYSTEREARFADNTAIES